VGAEDASDGVLPQRGFPSTEPSSAMRNTFCCVRSTTAAMHSV